MPHYVRFKCPAGNSSFSLSLTDEPIQPGIVIYFEHENLDQWVSELQYEGIEFTQLPTDQSYLSREAIVYDPSGNKLKLFWAGENRLEPPWK